MSVSGAALVGAIIGSMVGEYVLQPEWVLVDKSLNARVGGLHLVVWGCSVFAGMIAIDPELLGWRLVFAVVFAALIHGAIDCTRSRKRIQKWLGLQSVDGAIEMLHDEKVPYQVFAMQFALATASEGMFSLALHSVIACLPALIL